MRVTVHNQQPAVEVHTEQEVSVLLEAAAVEAKQHNKLNIVFVGADNGNELSIVVGGNESVLGFTYTGNEPPYFASCGQCQDTEPVLTAYIGLEHHTEFPRQWVISATTALAAVKAFCESPARPDLVTWVEV